MTKTPAQYLKEPYARILIPHEDGTYSAEMLEFPGCFAQGQTPNEAFKRLEEAAKGWIKAALDQGQEIPPPTTNQGFSGRVNLRLPRSLHRQAVRLATQDNASLNQFFTTAIAARVGAEELVRRFVDMMAQAIPTSTAMYNFTKVEANIENVNVVKLLSQAPDSSKLLSR